MRSERHFLEDISKAINEIEFCVKGVDESGFLASPLHRNAALRLLMVIGEAVVKVSDATKAKYPSVPWAKIKGFRNFTIHQYFALDWQIVWNAASINCPQLKPAIEQILKTEYPGLFP